MILKDLTYSEELVMKSIWDSDRKPVLSEVTKHVNDAYGTDWARQTVSTFLGRLVKKEYLQLQGNERRNSTYYKILVTEKEYRRKLYKRHISFWNHNDITEFINEMIDNGDLTYSDIEVILKNRKGD